jgi:hypothetical protein
MVVASAVVSVINLSEVFMVMMFILRYETRFEAVRREGLTFFTRIFPQLNIES